MKVFPRILSIVPIARRFLSRSRPEIGPPTIHPLTAIAAIDTLPPRLKLAAIAEALPHAGTASYPLLVQRWLALDHSRDPFSLQTGRAPRFGWILPRHASPDRLRNAWTAIVRRWAELPETLAADLQPLLRQRLRTAAIELTGDAKAAPAVIAYANSDPFPALRLRLLDRASQAFVDDPDSLLRMVGTAAAEGDDAAVAAAARAVGGHRSIEAVLAALEYADRLRLRRGGPVAEWLRSEAAIGGGSFRAAIRRASFDGALVRALELIRCEAWRSATVQRLTATPTPAQFAELCENAHLLENPHRALPLRSALREVPADRLVPSPSKRLVGSGVVRLSRLKPKLLAESVARVRLDGAAQIVAAGTGVTIEGTGIETRALRSAGLVRSLAGSLHERRPVRRAGARLDPPDDGRSGSQREDDLLAAASGPLARAHWLRRLASDRTLAIAELREACEQAETGVIADHIVLVRRLGLVNELSGWLGALALKPRPDGHRIAATAVTALGDSDGKPIRLALAALLGDSDSRVRANAVESLGRLLRRGDRDAAPLIELKPDPNHRVRANAIRALWLEDPRSHSALSDMLCDDRFSHRLAIAWSCRRLLLKPTLATSLRRRLESEPEPRVRELIAEAIAGTDRTHRLSWRAAHADQACSHSSPAHPIA